MFYQKKISVILNNGFNYNFHLRKKHSFEKFKENKLNCLSKNTEKQIGFSAVLRKTNVKIDRKTKEKINEDTTY